MIIEIKKIEIKKKLKTKKLANEQNEEDGKP